MLSRLFLILLCCLPTRAFAETAASTSSSSGDFGSCVSNFDTAKKACTDSSSTAGMSGAGASTMAAQLATVSTLVATASGTKAAAQACLISNGISSALQTINALKGDSCSSSRAKCMNACKSYANVATNQLSSSSGAFNSAFGDLSTIQSQLKDSQMYFKSCDGYSAQVSNSLAQALSIAQSLAQAYSCYSALTSNTATPTPVSLETASYDCSNANYAATNVVCICQNDPTNTLCASSTTGMTSSTGNVASSLTTPSVSTEESDGTVVADPPSFQGTSGTQGMQSSSGSGGLSGSGSGASLAGTDGLGSGASGVDKNVITGTSGGSGVAALTAAGSSGGASKSSGLNPSGLSSSSGFDLKKYLPKSLFKNRGLAGMTVPSTDGVTGAMGPSLWEKVSNRYQAVKPSLIQDR